MPSPEPESLLPPPASPPRAGDMPHALTFFLTRRQRRAVLRQLRRIDPQDRAAALLKSLRLRDEPAS